MENKKSISVVLPNYNGRNLLAENLPSVYEALHRARVDYEVIVADDASTDDSVVFLKENFKEVIVVSQNINSGFSPTINRGIAVASKQLVLLLNTDVFLLPNYFDNLFHYFDLHDTFGVSGRFIGLTDKKIQEAGKYPILLATKKIQPFNFYVENSSDFVPTFYLSGAGTLVDRNKLNQLRGFDEIYAPFYFEDTDLSMRAWRLGWRCYYEHNAVCRHPASTTIKKHNKNRTIWITTQRNKLIFHSLHLGSRSKRIWYTRQTLTLIFQAIVFRWKYHVAFFNFLEKRPLIQKSKERLLSISNASLTPSEKIIEHIQLVLNQKRIIKI